jgi:hypothetical protein
MTVEWTESALDRLADFFVAADLAGQDVLEATVRRINATLVGARRTWASPGPAAVGSGSPTRSRLSTEPSRPKAASSCRTSHSGGASDRHWHDLVHLG